MAARRRRLAAAGKPASGPRATSFYRGETASASPSSTGRGRTLAASDLAEFSVEVGPALRTTFGRYEVAACGFLVPGSVVLADAEPPRRRRPQGARPQFGAYLHRIIETVKLAFADRDAYYGDRTS